MPDTTGLPAPLNQLNKERLREIKDKIYDILRKRGAVLFGCAVEKNYAEVRREDPYWIPANLVPDICYRGTLRE